MNRMVQIVESVVAIARVELLYPLPEARIAELLAGTGKSVDAGGEARLVALVGAGRARAPANAAFIPTKSRRPRFTK